MACGRIAFEPQAGSAVDAPPGDAPTGVVDAAALTCWDGAIVVSEPGNAAFGVTLAGDDDGLYVMWSNAGEFSDGGALWFRAFEPDGTPRQAATTLAPGELGLVNAASPSMLARDGALLVTYSGHTGDINSGGQLRAIRLDLTGTPLGPSTHISNDFAAPSPGVTTGGGPHALKAGADGELVVGVHGKYPWGGAGAWLRGTYYIDDTTLERVGGFICHNCYSVRFATSGYDGATFHEAADDTAAMLAAVQEGSEWITRMRWIDRANALVAEAEVDRHVLGASPPSLAAAWDPLAERYVVLHSRLVDATYELRLSTIDGRVATSVRTLLSGPDYVAARILRRAAGGYWWVAATGNLVQVAQLTADLSAAGAIHGITRAEGDLALFEHAGRLIVGSRNAAANEVRLRCFTAD
jgi:hypothetical protein